MIHVLYLIELSNAKKIKFNCAPKNVPTNHESPYKAHVCMWQSYTTETVKAVVRQNNYDDASTLKP